jgi:hypothetical protein
MIRAPGSVADAESGKKGLARPASYRRNLICASIATRLYAAFANFNRRPRSLVDWRRN